MPTLEEQELHQASIELTRRLLAAAEQAVERIERAALGGREQGFRNDNERIACGILARLLATARPRRATAREQRETEWQEQRRRKFSEFADRVVERMKEFHDKAVEEGAGPDDMRIRAWVRYEKGLDPVGDSDVPLSEIIKQSRGG